MNFANPDIQEGYAGKVGHLSFLQIYLYIYVALRNVFKRVRIPKTSPYDVV